MSFCTIKRNSEGKITRVNKPNGSESKLFTRIAKHPLVISTEVAADIYKNIFSKTININDNTYKPVKAVKGNSIFNSAVPEVNEIEKEYNQRNGIEPTEFKGVTSINKGRAKVIAQLFEEMEDNPNSLEVREAYEAMAKETIAQYEFIKDKGYTIEVNNEEPYANSTEMLEELKTSKNMKIFSTESGFGENGITQKMRQENPLLAETKFKDINGNTLLVNDLFRFVHDFFGHAKLGNGFGPIGEENAWNVHARMYSEKARRAMTTETRGQNSWVNFSGVNDKVFVIRNEARKLRAEGKTEEAAKLVEQVYSKMKFAEQKVGLLPEWVSSIDYEMDSRSEPWGKLSSVQQANYLGYELNEKGSNIVNGKGEFKYSKATMVPVGEVVDKSLMNAAELKLLKYWGNTPIKMYGGRGQSEGMATYNSATNEIAININNALGGVVLSNQKEVNNAILHEIIHHVITKEVSDRKGFESEVFKLRDVILANKSLANDYVKNIIGYIENGSLEEVITYSMTNKPFAEFLDSIVYEQENGKIKTIWDKLIEFITGALKGNTLLTAVRNVMNEYSSTFNTISDIAIEKFDYELSDVIGATVQEYKQAETKAMEGYKTSDNRVDLQYDFKTEEELTKIVEEGGKLFLTKDGQAGAFVKANGNMGGLFKNPSSNKKGAAKILQEVRIQEGGAYFDSYATKLEAIYIKNGFKPVARLKFSEEAAPKGWDNEDSPLKDKPDVVLFKYEPNSGAKPGDGQYFETFEEAEEYTKSTITPSLSEDKVEFVHRLPNGTIVSSYRDTLLQTQEGDTIEIGLMVEGDFSPIVLARRDTNKNTEQGYIANIIKSGLLSEEKTKVGIDYVYEAAGETQLSKVINASLIKEDANAYLGTEGVVQDGFTFKLEKTRGKVKVLGWMGDVQVIDKSELDAMSYQELKNNYDNATDLITQREWAASKAAYRDVRPVVSEQAPVKSEEELELRLLNFLNKLGVKTMAISEYVKKYNLKHGVNPSAKALADIANQVVAYVKGDTESLSEEVAHFINEAFPKEKINNILRNIHKTAEWAEFNKKYREIYSKEYTGEILEDVVRREVLGKIVAKVISRQTETKTELQRNLFQRVSDVISEFFQNLRGLFRAEYSTELNQYLNEVEDMLSAEDISDYINISNFKDSTIRLYNVGNENSPTNKLRKKATLLAYQLQDTEKTLLGAGVGSKSSIRDLDKVQRNLEDALTVESILSLISMVNSNVRSLNAAITDSKVNEKSYYLSDEENVVYQTLKQVSGKAVSEIKVLLKQIKSEEKTKKWDNILKEIDDTILNIQELNAEAELIDSQNVQRLVNKIMDNNEIPETERELVTRWIEKAESDTNLFHSTFGQLVHAKDGLLNLSGQIIKDMSNEAQINHYQATKKYQDRLKELGVTESEIGQKLVDGQYIVSEYDFNEFKKQMDEIYAVSYKKVLEEALGDPNNTVDRLNELRPFTEMSIEELVEAKNNGELAVLTLTEENARKNLERPMVTPLIERTMIDSYYEEYERKLEKANINDVTKQELSNYLSDISQLKKKAYRKEGDTTILDFNSLSESDKIKLSDLHKRRKMMKSYTDESGELKPGLKYIRENGELQIDPITRQPIVGVLDASQLTEESIVALDLNKLDREFTNEQLKQGAQLFYDTLDRIDSEEGREAAIKFLEANAYTSLSQDFWDNLTISGDLVSRLEGLKEQSPELSDEITNTIFNIKVFTFKIKNIIKLHNRKNNPSEVEVELMSTTAKDSVKQLQKSLKEDIQKANKLLGDYEAPEADQGLLSGVSEVNESYRKELRALDLFENANDSEEDAVRKANEEIEFAKEHMSDENANLLESNRISVEQYLIGSRANVNQSVELKLQDMGYDVMDLNDPYVKAEVYRALTRGRLLPYYKRYTSEAYTEYTNGLQTATKLSEYIKDSQQVKDAFIEVSPNPTFFDKQENDQLNPNYNSDFNGGYLQPKLSKFKSEKFSELFGTISEGVSSKNNQLYQAYLATLEYNQNALEAMNVGETYNKYLLPQIRKQKIERFSKALKGNVVQNTKNFVKDTLAYTEDDMIQGEKMFGSDVKVIPKMYLNKLENPEDVSNDLFFSLALRAKEAYSRQAKVKYYGDLMSVYDKISTREMNGKDPKSSNTYKMVKSAIDYNLFGVKETVTYPVKTPLGTIDLTKMARMLLGFVKFRNLGLNIVIPITSLLTGEVTRKMETFVGEFLDSRSQKLGTREYRKIAADGMKEIGKINTEAKINVLGQFFKAFDMNDSFNNSNYNKFLRFLPRTGMALHSAANYPLYGKTMIGVLHDFRIIEGRMINKNDFMKAKKQEGVSMKEANKMWRETEDTVMYKYLNHEANQMTWNREALKEVLRKEGRELTEEELDEAIADMYTKAQKYISLVNSMIDGQIPEEDRVLAQRHYLLSYFMTHRGWLSIAIARRFKNRHLNLDTNLTEEGSYRSLYGYMGTFFNEWKEGNFYRFAGAFKETWNKSDELTRRNMRRVAIESGVLSTLMVLSLALRAAADDEDNEDLFALQLSNYLTYRTLNELSSVQFNISSNLFEAIESPFVGMNTIKNLYDIGEVFSGEEVKHGSYRGMSKRRRYITKMVPGMKQYFDLGDMNQTYETYKFYNTKNFSLTPANMLWANTVDKKD